MERRDFKFAVKANDQGIFEGHLAAFVEDQGGDVIVPGAFTRTLAAWKAKGKPVPLLWDHNPSEPIGWFSSLEEDSKGLAVTGQFALGVNRAREVYELVKANVVNGLSIGYSTVVQEFTESVRLLKELKLWEGSLCLWPMNEAATVTSVKDLSAAIDELKAGRVLSSGNRQLVADALSALQALLAAADASASSDEGNDGGKGTRQPVPPGASATPADVKALLIKMQETSTLFSTRRSA